jgi:beta-glucosidase
MVAHFATSMPVVHAGDLEAMKAPMDFLGINYTQGASLHMTVPMLHPGKAGLSLLCPSGRVRGVRNLPEGLYKVLKRVKEEYTDLPLYISENGTTLRDTLSEDGCVHDPNRVTYLHDHFAATHQAITEGCDVRGYFVWSLLDNFEWGFGFSKRFWDCVCGLHRQSEENSKDSAFSSHKRFGRTASRCIRYDS